jgi:hypothetical protein
MAFASSGREAPQVSSETASSVAPSGSTGQARTQEQLCSSAASGILMPHNDLGWG